MDHGSQYTSDDFRDQIKFWGIAPSYAFVAERADQRRGREVQPNHEGAGDSWTHLQKPGGSSCRRCRVQDRYNRDWRLEKLGFKSPLEASQERLMKLAA
ncbi:Mobile element protein [Caballeronia sordidicola]|uniref:Mobile element protein n=2 Tax=Caballeronia sordidicola TaxID=196367 RepID=A0A242N848_CABSO|nr:Mobile element protein [Caballeronia sordidicola]